VTRLTCVYEDTAPAAPATPSLIGERRCDFVIIGAGYTGLSAALHAAERGLRVTVLESHEPGWGAAGRNGGQVNPGLKHEPDEIAAHFGTDLGERLVEFSGGAPGFLFDLVDRLGLRCEAQRTGTLRAAYRSASLGGLDTQVAQWARRGVLLERLDAAATARLIGSDHYVGATRDPRGGSVNPLAYARALAQAAVSAGAMVAGRSRALSITRAGNDWRVATHQGAVLARQVLIATDGYSDRLWPGLQRSFVPVYSSMVASAPLPDAARARILAGGDVVYESGHVTTYYRVDAQGRLLIGGRGVQRSVRHLNDQRHLTDHVRMLWPDLAAVEWTHAWNGQFALTPNFYPRVHAPESGVLIALGYSGRGVAMATRLGAALAEAVAKDDLSGLPLPTTAVPHIPMHRFWRVGVRLGVALGRLRDRFGH
jgi:glycine/D-amino acid oxidase-like deaminating enzyme